MQRLHDGTAEHGNAVMALCQTNGKGQRGKQWHTGKDSNLALSITLQPDFVPLHEQFYLHCLVCTAVIEYLNKIHPSNNWHIKWPNDIFLNGKKLGGILIENVLKGNVWKYAVVGIGLNVNDMEVNQIHEHAISLQEAAGISFDIVTVAKGLLSSVCEMWPLFITNREAFFDSYNQYLFKKGETVMLVKEGIRFTTVVNNVCKNGRLICGDNQELAFNHGEVNWVLG